MGDLQILFQHPRGTVVGRWLPECKNDRCVWAPLSGIEMELLHTPVQKIEVE